MATKLEFLVAIGKMLVALATVSVAISSPGISSYGCTWEVWRALKKLEFPHASITRYTHAKHGQILKFHTLVTCLSRNCMLNKYYRCMLNVSWTENNSSHEILALVTCRCRTFVLVPMRKRLSVLWTHDRKWPSKDFQCWSLKWRGTAINMWIVSRIGKDGLKNRMPERLRDLEQSMISRHAVRVSRMAPNP